MNTISEDTADYLMQVLAAKERALYDAEKRGDSHWKTVEALQSQITALSDAADLNRSNATATISDLTVKSNELRGEIAQRDALISNLNARIGRMLKAGTELRELAEAVIMVDPSITTRMDSAKALHKMCGAVDTDDLFCSIPF